MSTVTGMRPLGSPSSYMSSLLDLRVKGGTWSAEEGGMESGVAGIGERSGAWRMEGGRGEESWTGGVWKMESGGKEESEVDSGAVEWGGLDWKVELGEDNEVKRGVESGLERGVENSVGSVESGVEGGVESSGELRVKRGEQIGWRAE